MEQQEYVLRLQPCKHRATAFLADSSKEVLSFKVICKSKKKFDFAIKASGVEEEYSSDKVEFAIIENHITCLECQFREVDKKDMQLNIKE